MMSKLNKLFMFMRLIHIYVSSALFLLLIFFCVTGITLNHPEWFSNNARQQHKASTLPDSVAIYQQQNRYHWLAQVSQHIDEKYGLQHPKSVEWDDEMTEVIFDFPVPAGYASVIVNYQSREVFVDFQQGGIVQLMNDLRKGRHTGDSWRWLIDGSAVLMIIFAISGLVLLYQNRRKRQTGSWLVLSGLLAPLFIYLLLVPSLHGV